MLRDQERKRMLRSTRQFDALRPVLKAYGFAYLTSTLPRLLSIFRDLQRDDVTLRQKLRLLRVVFTTPFGLNRFPTSCAIIVGGNTVVARMLERLLVTLQHLSTTPIIKSMLEQLTRQAGLITTFISAWVAFRLLNRDEAWKRKRANSRTAQLEAQTLFESPNQHHLPPPGYHMSLAGKTIDFTLFALCRAIDVAVVSIWYKATVRWQHSEKGMPRWARFAQKLADPWVFSTSAAVIMWSWFYAPERLPKAYNKWISKVANIDQRLIRALRMCRSGEIIYGIDTGHDADLPALCKELSLPVEWGDPSTTEPIPCELYHCGMGKSCEIHAGTRFLKTFQFAIQLYLPLQLISMARRVDLSSKRLLHMIRDAARSSSFLAAFVSLFYYAVCLARTRLGPRVFSKTTVTPQMWDSGLCVLVGCLACGWSILLEKAGRQQEIAFFVAPRALATILPRVYDKQYQRREQLVFAASVAIVMNAARNKSPNVRGTFGKILEYTLR